MKEPLNQPGFWILLVCLGVLLLLILCGVPYMLGELLLSQGPCPWLP